MNGELMEFGKQLHESLERARHDATVADAIATLADVTTAADAGAHLTCQEVEALAVVFRAVGAPELAEMWLDEHSLSDEEGDQHWQRGEDIARKGFEES